MGRKTKKYHGGRAMLNDPGHHGLAAIIAEVEDSEAAYPPGGDVPPSWYTPNYIFQIADCDRHISLELDFDDAKGRKNTLKKIDRLIDTLTAFREGVKLEQERYVRNQRRAER